MISLGERLEVQCERLLKSCFLGCKNKALHTWAGGLVSVCVKERGETRTDHSHLISARFYIFLVDCHLNCPSKKEIII